MTTNNQDFKHKPLARFGLGVVALLSGIYGGLGALAVPISIYGNRVVSGGAFPNPADFDEKHAALITSAGEIGTSAVIAVVSLVICHFAIKHFRMKKS